MVGLGTGMGAPLLIGATNKSEGFEAAYKNQHIPMVEKKLKGMTRLVATKVLSSSQGPVTTYRLAEVHFPSIEDLNKCAESDSGKVVIARWFAKRNRRVYW